MLFGFVMDYSSSYIFASERFGDGYYFVKKHLLFLVIGGFLMYFFARVNYLKFKKIIFPMYALTILLLLLTLVPGVGVKISGARRWLNVGLFRFQTSELAKVTLIFFAANYYSRHSEYRDSFKKFVVMPLLLLSALLLPVLAQPDFSTMMLLVLVMAGLLIAAGIKKRHIVYLAVPVIGFAVAMIAAKPYRLKRVTSFLNPWNDPANSGFQIIQSFLALYSGGVLGVGLGDSREKLFYLPEAHNDFIFAVIGEELGFVGVLLTIILYFMLIYRGTRIAIRCNDPFGRLLVFGIIFMFSIQVILNMGVVLGLFPVTGLTLPFVSYGGASLLVLMSLAGIVLGVSRRNEK
ncbi:MAG: putative lipid II flippase FtsW [Oligoflexia bacterium]|nr:putative lipid II flippase FtsW [Oligoflexia bacterium]